MGKLNRLPREEATSETPSATDVPDGSTDTDVEGHRAPSGDRVAPRLPGTGGDFRRPSGGGELTDEDDVEGHRASLHPSVPGTGGDIGPRLPSTGGEYRRPSGGGEIAVDTEGDRS
ncbi:MAG TPA: hypothetical protein VGO64_06295 [Candidatus Limnocylindrales bacterium]|jgi:hypothetical protein|nr:hypothetical protein [Candidatus Limnocylindrales bacterium]